MLDKVAFWRKKDDEPAKKDFTDPEFGRDFLNPDNETGLDNPFDEKGGDPSQPDAFGVPKEFDPGRSFEVRNTMNNSPGNQNQLSSINEQLLNKNIEIVSSKIDTIKSEIENMNQRLTNIEAFARKDSDKDAHKRYTSARW
jgi:hypothetical protein